MDLIAWAIKLLYRLFSLFPQRDKIVFLSRQSPRPFDFIMLESHLKTEFPQMEYVWVCISGSARLDVPTMIKQLWHAATAKVCFVDGYVPAVSIPSAPKRALCIQVWHAPGAIKKFGYQSLDTPDGRSSRAAKTFSMHRGYDYIVAGFPGACAAYAEAFGYPVEKILPLGLPRMDYLASAEFKSLRKRHERRVLRRLESQGFDAKEEGPIVLYAPTFRRAPQNPRWLEEAVEGMARELPSNVRLIVSGHPIDGVNVEASDDFTCKVYQLTDIATIHALPLADCVVTDYSTVALEAGYVHKRVYFYTPDIEEYRLSPGLNVDPERELPTLTHLDVSELCGAVIGDVSGGGYDIAAFESFMQAYGMGSVCPSNAVESIASLARPYIMENTFDEQGV